MKANLLAPIGALLGLLAASLAGAQTRDPITETKGQSVSLREGDGKSLELVAIRSASQE